jgi:hypothetical protein
LRIVAACRKYCGSTSDVQKAIAAHAEIDERRLRCSGSRYDLALVDIPDNIALAAPLR